MKFFDAHVHIHLLNSDLSESLALLQRIGLAGFAALIIADYPKDESVIKKMVPRWFHHNVTLNNFNKDQTFLPAAGIVKDLDIHAYADSRFIGTDIDRKVDNFHKNGFKGIKVLYVPEADAGMQMEGMQRAFGRNSKDSEKITTDIIAGGAKHGMSILLHIDLRKYESFASEMISSFPQTPFNIAHLGFSRRKISRYLDKFDNCYSDLSSLTDHIRNEPAGYLDFITHYQDRILFGSDTIISDPRDILNAKTAIDRLIKDKTLRKKILAENYRKFHNNGST